MESDVRRAAVLTLLCALCGSQASVAQTNIVDVGNGVFAPTANPAIFTQFGPVGNTIGLIQNGTVLTASINQLGFYNRAAVIEVGTISTNVNLTQTGAFSHALVIQVSPTNTAAIIQNGSNSTAVLNQSATSAITGLSSAGLSLLASNFLYAPENASALPRLAEVDNDGFARSLFDRLDVGGPRQCLVPTPAALVARGAGRAQSPTAVQCAFAVFASGNVDTGDRHGILGASGFSSTTGRISFGGDYAVSPGFVAGPIFDLSRTGANLDRGSAHADLDTFHAGAYASYDRFGAFAHVVTAYGFDSYRLTRPGFLNPVTGKPAGDSVVAAGKFGYLVDLGSLRIGPVGSLSYARGAVDGFTESGDPLLTQRVAPQATRDVVGGGGLRIRFDVPLATTTVSPFLDVMAEQAHSLDGQRIVSSAFTFAPAQTLLTPVKAIDETYGRVAGGMNVQLGGTLQLGLAAQSSFARSSGSDFAFTGHLGLAF